MLEQKKMAPCRVRHPSYRDRTAVVCSEGWVVPFRNLRPISPINSRRMDDRFFVPSREAGDSAEQDQSWGSRKQKSRAGNFPID